MTLAVDGGGLFAFVSAGRGGKIVSLVDVAGTEWLAQADPARHVDPAAAFVASEMAGWDECAPSIVACTIDGRDVPDHGDLWNIPFHTEGDTHWAIGTSLGYRFERTITSVGDGLLLSYRAETLGDPLPFLWAAHPQFSAPAGTRVELPENVRTVVDTQDPDLQTHAWSRRLGTIDTVPSGGSRKWYVEPAQHISTTRIVRPDGSCIIMSWSSECRYFGVWFDNRAYSSEPVIALEPSTGYFDSLATAVSNRRVAMLLPGKPLEWWVKIAYQPRSS